MAPRCITVALISALPLQGVPQAQDSAGLKERLADVHDEAARLGHGMSAAEREWFHAAPADGADVGGQERIGALLRITERGTKISLRLRDGRDFEGDFEKLEGGQVDLVIGLTEESKKSLALESVAVGTKVRKHFPLESIESAQVPYPDGWFPPNEITHLDGKRVKLLLLSGETKNGRLAVGSNQGIRLDVGNGRVEEYDLDRIVAVDPEGRSRTQKWVIAGVVLGVAAGMYALFSNACFEYGC